MIGSSVRGAAAVASPEPLAADVGIRILRAGGNAADAAVAMGLALAATLPAAGNLGGGGFWMWRGRDGRTGVVDYRETAPRRATAGMYVGPDGKVRTDSTGPVTGWLASGVPGTPAGLEVAWRRFGSGRLRWADLVEPAVSLCADGFQVSDRLHASLAASANRLRQFESSRAIYLESDNARPVGSVLRQPDLAATLRRLRDGGARSFYTGETAALIEKAVRAGGGILDRSDLASYRVRERQALTTRYRGNLLHFMPPPSSGGIAIAAMLAMLERWEVHRFDPADPARAHRLVEAMRRAFADRSEWLGDPDFVRVNARELASSRRADHWVRSFQPRRASRSLDLAPGKPLVPESPETTHFTVVDRDGNAVSNTYTLNGNYGSAAVADGTGVLLNNEMDDFAAALGVPNQFGLIQSARNAIAPGKRPLSSMSPTIVEDREGRLRLALGSPGGPTIINSVLQVLLLVLDHDWSAERAVGAPRVHHQWLPDEIVAEPDAAGVRSVLEDFGHRFGPSRLIGDVQAVALGGDGTRWAASDPRGAGRSASL